MCAEGTEGPGDTNKCMVKRKHYVAKYVWGVLGETKFNIKALNILMQYEVFSRREYNMQHLQIQF